MRRLVLTSLTSMLLLTGMASTAGAQVETLMYDHVHMAVPTRRRRLRGGRSTSAASSSTT